MMNWKYHLADLSGHPLHLVARKILAKMTSKVMMEFGALRLKLFSIDVSDKRLLKSISGEVDGIDDLIASIRVAEKSRFFFECSEREKIVDLIKAHYSDTIEQTIADADKILSNTFDLLGSGDHCFGQVIDWHIDFKTGWRWRLKYYRKVDRRDYHRELMKPYDVKVPWELSQCQHFITLGKAYWYTKDEKYAEGFVTQVDHWIQSNPPRMGINWACTMKVAIRLVNWIWAYNFFRDSPTVDDQFIVRFMKSLLIHGKHIAKNLEKTAITHNHYLSDLSGLIYLGIAFPGFEESQAWRTFGVRELIKEMDRQVFPDGMDYEGSIFYHRFVTELFISLTVLCLKNQSLFQDFGEDEISECESLPFPDWYMERLEKMIDLVMNYTKPDGTAPQIGDSDDGRLHILSNYGNWDRLDHTYLLSMGAILFGNSEFKAISGKLHEESFWLFGASSMEEFSEIPGSDFRLSSRGFPCGGLYVMRNPNIYAVVDCLNQSSDVSTSHFHNSRLSFELYMLGATAIVDPGTYTYTADVIWRNHFRSTKYHNTLTVDDYEQNIIDPYAPFENKTKANVRVNLWEKKEHYDLLDAEHDGFLDISVTHRRQFLLDKKRDIYMIKDFLCGSGTHIIEAFFHIAPSIKPFFHQEKHNVVLCELPQGTMALIPVAPDDLSVSLEPSWSSYSYGTRDFCTVVHYSLKRQLPVAFSFIFCDLSLHPDIHQNIEDVMKYDKLLRQEKTKQ